VQYILSYIEKLKTWGGKKECCGLPGQSQMIDGSASRNIYLLHRRLWTRSV